MSAGDLDVRVPESGDDEIAAVADALNSLAETLQQEEGLRKESVADLAHELRTPVMGMLARVEAAQDGVLEDEEANLSAMHDEALRLARLLDDLSALAEAERPGLLLDAEPVDLAAIAGVADGGVRRRVRRQGHRAVLRSAAGDRRRRPQAARADRREPALQRPALHRRGRHRPRRVRREDGEGVLEVADTGIGIAAEDLPRVFTRFWRGEKSRSRDTGGAGIGLSIVKELVQAHGGTSPSRAPGEGSVFRVTLPVSDGAAARLTLVRQAASGWSAAWRRLRTSWTQSAREDIAISSRRSRSCSSTCGARSRMPLLSRLSQTSSVAASISGWNCSPQARRPARNAWTPTSPLPHRRGAGVLGDGEGLRVPLQRHELAGHALEEQVAPDQMDRHPADGRLGPVEDATAVDAGELLGAEADAEQGQLALESSGEQQALLKQEGKDVVLIGVHGPAKHDERAECLSWSSAGISA